MKTTSIICFAVLSLLICHVRGNPGELTQVLRGSVTDRETTQSLVSATVAVYCDSLLLAATITDQNGVFRIEGIPVGRCRVAVSYVGYQEAQMSDVIVNSVKEVVLPFELEESPVHIDELKVLASTSRGNALNTHALTSSRIFSAEESERYPGSRGDPARMASNFAGVQGNDDSNNDLVIRGNSPLGVLWRLEGVNIPNPNHFGVCGSTGGPVSILNNKVLGLSDFMTGAFPAEFGNSNAGVFDLSMRNGNNERHEFSAQLGILGVEAMAEGPVLKKHRSSYLATYRYSTLDIFRALGIQVGTDAMPAYQDISFKLNFPGDKSGIFSLFGIGGNGAVDILASEQVKPDPNSIYGDEAMDEHFRTGMGVLGVNYTRPVGDKSRFRATVAASREQHSNRHDKVFRHVEEGLFVVDSIREPHMGYSSVQDKFTGSFTWNRKISSRHSLRAGLTLDVYRFQMEDSIYNESSLDFVTRLDHHGLAGLFQPFIQWKYKSAGGLTLTGGIHGQYLELDQNRSYSLEPRLGMNYQLNPDNALSAGLGMHSQMIPTYIYFVQFTDDSKLFTQPNMDLGFIRSFHSVLSWTRQLNENMRIKAEAYYQQLYQVPVEKQLSSYSILDEGHDMNRFFPDSLVNKGKGNNYGLEFTFEKFFSRAYFLMATASLYDARRTGSDGRFYESVYSGGYAMNLMGGKEFRWGDKKRSSFTLGGKLTLAGGKRYTPIDTLASAIAGEAVYVDEQRNAMQFRPYFRADLKLTYRLNAVRVSHEIGLDIVNVTNRKNILKQTYVSGAEPPVIEKYQLGLLPIIFYRIDF